MSKAQLRLGTHIVVKEEDKQNFLSDTDQHIFNYLLEKISDGRLMNGKEKYPVYYVVNKDEPYAQEIIDLILTRESEKDGHK